MTKGKKPKKKPKAKMLSKPLRAKLRRDKRLELKSGPGGEPENENPPG